MAIRQQQFWRMLRGWLNGNGGPARDRGAEDPETLLARAQEEMRAVHARNRERAVKAITQKNNLQQLVSETEKKVEILRQQVAQAEANGDARTAQQMRGEQEQYVRTLELTRSSLEEAIAVAEQVKEAIHREEEVVRRKTAQAMTLRAQWRVLQIQREIVHVAAKGLRPGQLEAGNLSPEQRHALLEQARTQRDELARLTEGASQRVLSLRDKAALARQRGNEEMERALLREMEQNEATLAQMREALAQAVEVTTRAEKFLAGEADPETLAHWEALAENVANGRQSETLSERDRREAIVYGGILVLAVVMALLALWVLLA